MRRTATLGAMAQTRPGSGRSPALMETRAITTAVCIYLDRAGSAGPRKVVGGSRRGLRHPVLGGIAWSKYRSRQAKPADPGITTLSPSRTLFAAPSIIAWFQGPGASAEIGDPALRGGGHDATGTPDYRVPSSPHAMGSDPIRLRHLSSAYSWGGG